MDNIQYAIKIGDIVTVEAQGVRYTGTVTHRCWSPQYVNGILVGGGWIIEADAKGEGQRYFLWKQNDDGGRIVALIRP